MPQVRWQARSDGLYWIDVALGTRSFSLMIDLGLVDLNGRVGFSVEPAIYAQLKKAGQLKDFLQQSNRDASGKIFSSESGRLAAQLIDPITFLPVGPTVRLHVMRGATGVPSRVGVVFFHHLKGCQVSWDLDNRVWSIDYP
jgi:hypothetical protein